MAESDELLRTIEAIHAAGLDESLWPASLEAVTHLIGGAATTFEVADKQTHGLTDFWSFGIPPVGEMTYADHFMAINPRYSLGLRQSAGDLGYDSMLIDEEGMRRDPYYAEFLHGLGLRYFVSSIVSHEPEQFACVAVHRSPRQGHVTMHEIALMDRLGPHLRNAFDTTMRLRAARQTSDALRDALDWLADGVMLLRADGTIAYCNDAMRALARRGDGLRIVKDRVEFVSKVAGGRFAEAVGGAARLSAGDASSQSPCDFPVPRAKGKPPLLLSLRPLPRGRNQGALASAVSIVFVYDPMGSNAAVGRLLREMYGLTDAEAAVAQALRAGMSPTRYARERAVSPNTVYTHLRRIKDKTGCRRLPELIRKLNEARTSLRDG